MASSPMNTPTIEEFVGKIILITGCMFSGKTTELIRLINRYRYAKRSVLVIKPNMDKRYSIDEVQTHLNLDGFRLSVGAIAIDDIYNITETRQDGTIITHDPLSYDVIAIDEGNLFKSNLIDFAEDMANKNKIVLVCGLNGDIEQQPLGHLHELFHKADRIEHFDGVCFDCGKDAAFTWSDKKRKKGEFVQGHNDIYVSVCRLCRNLRRALAQTREIEFRQIECVFDD